MSNHLDLGVNIASITGQTLEKQNKPVAQFLDTLDAPMRAHLQRAMHTEHVVSVYREDHNSLLIFNKAFGYDVTVKIPVATKPEGVPPPISSVVTKAMEKIAAAQEAGSTAPTAYSSDVPASSVEMEIIKDGKPWRRDAPAPAEPVGETEDAKLWFFAHRVTRDQARNEPMTAWVFLQGYGGQFPNGFPKPALMHVTTRDLMATKLDNGKGGIGWRTLLYANKGPDDPIPSGIVALEGWYFTSRVVGGKKKKYEIIEVDDPEEAKKAFQVITFAALESLLETPKAL